VLAKIAGGGLSTLYLGRRFDDAALVALKVVRHDLRGDQDIQTMFSDEARLLERLVHPNIVRTYEHGVDGDHSFISMELLRGTTLAGVQKACAARGMGLHPEAVAWIGARVADALHYAHDLVDERGEPLAIIHRDVNPANIFLTFDGEVKLIDFGLAKSHGRATVSLPGMIKGKLPYLSPEQIMQLPIDRRCDVFGLGTTLWELCTMRRLFGRDNDIATVRAVHCGPIPDPRVLASDVPPELAAIIVRSLERNRDLRFESAGQLAQRLDAMLVGRARGRAAAASPRAQMISARQAGPRLAEMQRALFPQELERQRGWSKPAPTGVVVPFPRTTTTTTTPSPPDQEERERDTIPSNPPPFSTPCLASGDR
jgi:serine/threonine protein kinase